MYGFWDIKCKGQSFLSFWAIFALDPPKNPKNQNFEKIKKTLRDIIILHLSITNDDHMMYGSWDTEHDRKNVILGYFLPF